MFVGTQIALLQTAIVSIKPQTGTAEDRAVCDIRILSDPKAHESMTVNSWATFMYDPSTVLFTWNCFVPEWVEVAYKMPISVRKLKSTYAGSSRTQRKGKCFVLFLMGVEFQY